VTRIRFSASDQPGYWENKRLGRNERLSRRCRASIAQPTDGRGGGVDPIRCIALRLAPHQWGGAELRMAPHLANGRPAHRLPLMPGASWQLTISLPPRTLQGSSCAHAMARERYRRRRPPARFRTALTAITASRSISPRVSAPLRTVSARFASRLYRKVRGRPERHEAPRCTRQERNMSSIATLRWAVGAGHAAAGGARLAAWSPLLPSVPGPLHPSVTLLPNDARSRQ